MIKELSDFGKLIRTQKHENKWVHDALKEETISLVLTINSDGSFISLTSIEKRKTIAEALQRTSGKGARLLLDNCGYVLGIYDPESTSFKNKVETKGEKEAHGIFQKEVSEKHSLFLNRLNNVCDLDELIPIFKFYFDNKKQGIDIVNQEYFLKNIPKTNRGGNIALLVLGQNKYVHEYNAIYKRIIADFEVQQTSLLSTVQRKCAICANKSFPVGDFTHYPIKGVPGDKEPAGGRKFISYNEDAFESYNLKGNENCMICTNCAKTYVEGLNWLLSNGTKIPVTKNKNGKEKAAFRYTNRKNFGKDTAIVFWTRNNKQLPELDQLEEPNPSDIIYLIESVSSGTETRSRYLDSDQFYSFTLSGSAARIVVRDWIETSLSDCRKSIAKWFQDIEIIEYNWDTEALETHYSGLYDLARSCQRKNSDNSLDKDDTTPARIAAHLWKVALKNTPLPLWILTKVLRRARLNKKGVTAEMAALIKLVLNRNNKGGDFVITKESVQGERPMAYICGQIFAKLESIQYAVLGERNAGIRERYFTYAMTMPSSAFGRLFNLNSKHFTKLKSEKSGLAVKLDKELQDLCKDIDINRFPVTFALEEQGQFAIGYYHQKQRQFNGNRSKENTEE